MRDDMHKLLGQEEPEVTFHLSGVQKPLASPQSSYL
jgi:hypothetical protein